LPACQFRGKSRVIVLLFICLTKFTACLNFQFDWKLKRIPNSIHSKIKCQIND
jgi:hypothetical protein